MKKFFLIIFLIVISFTFYAMEPVVLHEAENPRKIITYDNYLYVIEDYSIKIYSLNDFKFIKQFARMGEGPGEFKHTIVSKVIIADNKILVGDVERFLLFNLLGEYIKENKTTQRFGRVVPIKGKFVTVRVSTLAHKAVYMIDLLDSDFNKIKNLYIFEISRDDFHLIRPDYKIEQCMDKILITDSGKDLIVIFDESGNEETRIKLTIKKKRVTEEDKRKLIEEKKILLKGRWELVQTLYKKIFCPDYFPIIKRILTKDGRIFIGTYNTKNGRCEFIILDFKGNILKRVFLPEAGVFTVNENKYYYLKENKNEKWELHTEKIR